MDKNECLDQSLHDCSSNAECLNTEGSFTCKCNRNFVDQGEPEFPGRKCVKDWRGIKPETRAPELDTWVVIVFCAIAFLFIALLVSFVIWKKKCNRNKEEDIRHERMSADTIPNPHGMEKSK